MTDFSAISPPESVKYPRAHTSQQVPILSSVTLPTLGYEVTNADIGEGCAGIPLKEPGDVTSHMSTTTGSASSSRPDDANISPVVCSVGSSVVSSAELT